MASVWQKDAPAANRQPRVGVAFAILARTPPLLRVWRNTCRAGSQNVRRATGAPLLLPFQLEERVAPVEAHSRRLVGSDPEEYVAPIRSVTIILLLVACFFGCFFCPGSCSSGGGKGNFVYFLIIKTQ